MAVHSPPRPIVSLHSPPASPNPISRFESVPTVDSRVTASAVFSLNMPHSQQSLASSEKTVASPSRGGPTGNRTRSKSKSKSRLQPALLSVSLPVPAAVSSHPALVVSTRVVTPQHRESSVGTDLPLIDEDNESVASASSVEFRRGGRTNGVAFSPWRKRDRSLDSSSTATTSSFDDSDCSSSWSTSNPTSPVDPAPVRSLPSITTMAPLQPPSRTTRQSPVTNRKNPSPSKKSPPVSHVPPSARGWTRSTPSSTTMGAARIVNVGPPRPVVPMPRRSSLKKPSPPNKLLADRPRSLSASDVSVVRFIDGVTINRTYSKDEYDRSVIEVDALTEMDRVVYALFKSSLPVGVDCPSVGKSVLKVDVPSGLVGRSGDQISAAVGAGPEREASCVDALIFVFPDLNGLPSLANNLMEKAEQCARSVVRGW